MQHLGTPPPSDSISSLTPVSRDSVLALLDEYREDTSRHVVVLHGPPGIGKSTILRQYAARHDGRCVFIDCSPQSPWSYDVDYQLHVLGSQLFECLYPNETPPSEFTRKSLGRAYAAMKRAHRHSRLPFLLDGLSAPSTASSFDPTVVCDLLPTGLPGALVIVAADDLDMRSLFPGQLLQEQRILGFTASETAQALSGHLFSPEDMDRLHNLSGGVPGILATAVTLLANGQSLEDLTARGTDLYAQLFTTRWAASTARETQWPLLVALVALARVPHPVSRLAAMLSWPTTRVEQVIHGSDILTINEHGRVHFASAIVEQLARTACSAEHARARDMILQHLLSDATTVDAVAQLPTYLVEAGRVNDLYDYLSPRRMPDTMTSLSSVLPIVKGLRSSLSTADQITDHGAVFRLALQASTVSEFAGGSALEAELRALVALDCGADALDIAHGVPLKEQRLDLLVSAADAMSDLGRPLADHHRLSIERLVAEIGPDLPPERAIELGTALLSMLPQLGGDLIRTALNSTPAGSTWDRALARAAIAAALSPEAVRGGADTALMGQIKSPEARRISEAIGRMVKARSSSEFLDGTRTVERTADRIAMMREWAVLHRRRSDATAVTRAGLDAVVADPTYAASASDVLRLCQPLPHCPNPLDVAEIVRRVDSQAAVLRTRGPTAAYWGLEALLARSVYSSRPREAHERFLSALTAVVDIPDLAARLEATALLLGALVECQLGTTDDDLDTLAGAARDILQRARSEAVQESADHLSLLRPIIAALSTHDRQELSDTIAAANTAYRRDLLRQDCIRVHSERAGPSALIPLVTAFVQQCESESGRVRVAYAACSGLRDRRDVTQLRVDDLTPLVTVANSLLPPQARAACLTECIALCARMKETETHLQLLDSLIHSCQTAWSTLMDAWECVELEFAAASAVARSDRKRGLAVLDSARDARRALLRNSVVDSAVIVYPLRLAVAGLAAMGSPGIAASEEIQRLITLMGRLPSLFQGGRLVNALVVYLKQKGLDTDVKQLVEAAIWPRVEKIKDNVERARYLMEVGPALFWGGRSLFERALRHCSPDSQAVVVANVVETIFQGAPADEPCSTRTPEQYEHIGLTDVNDILGLLYQYRLPDYDIGSAFARVSDLMTSGSGRRRFTQEQRADCARQMEDVRDSHLPDPEGVNHDGWCIYVDAHIARLRGNERALHDALCKRARRLPNRADRVFVLCELARTLSRDNEARRQTIENACIESRAMPIEDERIATLQEIGWTVWEWNETWARQLVQEARSLCWGAESDRISDILRRMVDRAYRFDPNFATLLCQVAGDDQARNMARAETLAKEMRRRLTQLTDERLFAEGTRRGKALRRQEMPRLAWQALARLNAGRINANADGMTDLLREAAEMPLSEAFPVLLWAMRNIALAGERKKRTDEYVRPFVDGAILVAEMAAAVSFPATPRATRTQLESAEEEGLAVPSGPEGLEAAKQYLQRWIRETESAEIILCDPYFGAEEVWLIRMIQAERSGLRVRILTQAGTSVSLDAILKKWREVSDEEPPATEIVVVSSNDRNGPWHDRFLLAGNRGLHLGHSLNGLGGRESRITPLSTTAVAEEMDRILDYLEEQVSEHRGERLHYSRITL